MNVYQLTFRPRRRRKPTRKALERVEAPPPSQPPTTSTGCPDDGNNEIATLMAMLLAPGQDILDVLDPKIYIQG